MTNDKSQPIFVLKVFAYSAIAAVVIKYILPYIPALANNGLTESEINTIALLAISLPVAIFAGILWWKK